MTDSNSDTESKRIKGHRDKKRKRHKKRIEEHDAASSSVDDSSYRRRKHRKKRRKKEKKMKKKEKKAKSKKSHHDREIEKHATTRTEVSLVDQTSMHSNDESRAALRETSRVEEQQQQQKEHEKREKARSMAPMSREQYEMLQSTVREVYDEQSGRYRLVRGTGEIIERIVSRHEHSSINQRATHGDGNSFSRGVFQAARERR